MLAETPGRLHSQCSEARAAVAFTLTTAEGQARGTEWGGEERPRPRGVISMSRTHGLVHPPPPSSTRGSPSTIPVREAVRSPGAADPAAASSPAGHLPQGRCGLGGEAPGLPPRAPEQAADPLETHRVAHGLGQVRVGRFPVVVRIQQGQVAVGVA